LGVKLLINMRIIGGKLKGKTINFIKNQSTRPLKDSVKENIFNILKHSNILKVKIENSNVLDLYSGVGSFGLESISRGAKKVTFVEQDKIAASVLRDNLSKLSILDKAIVIQDEIKNIFGYKKKFNILFFDPPFSDKNFIDTLELFKESKIYEEKHILIIHREKNSFDQFENIIDIDFTKTYGRSKIIFGVFN
tara:strand:- start:187 stop:765 length:579 start_codon:yes stop_codon:yes gene_type:complete